MCERIIPPPSLSPSFFFPLLFRILALKLSSYLVDETRIFVRFVSQPDNRGASTWRFREKKGKCQLVPNEMADSREHVCFLETFFPWIIYIYYAGLNLFRTNHMKICELFNTTREKWASDSFENRLSSKKLHQQRSPNLLLYLKIYPTMDDTAQRTRKRHAPTEGKKKKDQAPYISLTTYRRLSPLIRYRSFRFHRFAFSNF